MAKNKFEQKTIRRAQNILAKFPNDETIYFKELKKSLNEYEKLVNIDKTTKDLYLNHINDLNNIISDSKNSNRIITSLIIVLFAMFFLTLWIAPSKSVIFLLSGKSGFNLFYSSMVYIDLSLKWEYYPASHRGFCVMRTTCVMTQSGLSEC